LSKSCCSGVGLYVDVLKFGTKFKLRELNGFMKES
jgi:hypothetical protein